MPQHPLDEHLALDAQLLKQRIEIGDDLTKPREVDYSINFRSSRQAKRAAAELDALGWRTETRTGLFRSSLEAHRVTAVQPEDVERNTRQIFEIADRFDGELDGWGAVALIPDS